MARALEPNEFECPKCGTPVFHDLLACPKCGQRMYPDDDEADLEEAAAARARGKFSLSAVLVGWLVASVIAFLVNFIASLIWASRALDWPGQLLLLFGPLLGTLLGGLLAAQTANIQPSRRMLVLHGAAVGALSLISGVLLDSYWIDLSRQAAPVSAVLRWVGLLLAGPLGAYLEARNLPPGTLADQLFGAVSPTSRASAARGQRKRAQPASGRSSSGAIPLNPPANMPAASGLPGNGLSTTEDRLYLDLLARVQYDFEEADTRIETERRAAPAETRLAWIQRAIQRIDQHQE